MESLINEEMQEIDCHTPLEKDISKSIPTRNFTVKTTKTTLSLHNQLMVMSNKNNEDYEQVNAV